ncbi:HIT family protein [Methylocystis parvus]|uniref:HIT family protein n=1 Tax=Methylocystis parvus TaxID=134 RepID=A0A6B8MBD6_9HYPH|nr:HIT family protein [Methylocystis parvus]QGM97960.1 HIT family protein [Methylocystis parvus]WBK01726.1 HIT family protein [Methylocystis parvus OBBP]
MALFSCPFCDRASLSILCENDLAFAIRDKFPVRPLHSLILPKRHAADIFDTVSEEREAIHRLAETLRGDIMREDPSVGGFNFGSNIGAVAGQKIPHAHLHLIPRRSGDTPPPAARHD